MWACFKSKAVKENRSLWKALTPALSWQVLKPKNGKSFLDVGVFRFNGPDVAHLSEKIDEIY